MIRHINYSRFAALILLIVSFFSLMCTKDMPTISQNKTSNIVLNITINHDLQRIEPKLEKKTVITQVTVTITASDMETITKNLTGSGDTYSGVIEVPQGSGRTFSIEAKDANSIVQYKGSTLKDLNASTETIDITLDPQYPTAVTATMGTITDNSITLNWSQSIDADFNFYRITRKETSGSHDVNDDKLVDIKTSKSTTSYTDTGLPSEKTYYYKVWVVDTEMLAKSSSEVSGTTLSSKFEFIVNNPVFTDIKFTISGKGTYTINDQDNGSIFFDTNPGIVIWSAETSGETSTGTQVGEKITWSGTNDISGKSSITLTLNISSSYFFLYFKHHGTHEVDYVVVNYGLVSQRTDHITFAPSSTLRYKLGYYKAFTNSNVRVYYKDEDIYTIWYQGTHFTLPFTENQSVELIITNSLSKILTNSEPEFVSNIEPDELFPDISKKAHFKNIGIAVNVYNE